MVDSLKNYQGKARSSCFGRIRIAIFVMGGKIDDPLTMGAGHKLLIHLQFNKLLRR